MVQFGLCLWIFDDGMQTNVATSPAGENEAERLRKLIKSSMTNTPPTQKIRAIPYNFYLFKSASGRGSNVFSCQNTCLKFLVANKMDLNKGMFVK